MMLDLAIVAAKAFLVLFMVLNLAGVLGWVERKGSALIQDRIGANRASVFGFAGMGLVNTLIADPIKMLTKEDFIPAHGDRLLHTLAPCLALFPALVTFAVIPFGDVLVVGGREINLQVANLNIGILYIFAMASLSVYGIVIGAWASNNKFSLLGGVRGAAQMVSYEIAMGLSVIGIIMVYGTLEPQAMVRAQGELLWGWLPDWGVVRQPLAFLLFFTAAAAGLITTLFFGGWQAPYLLRDGFHFPWGSALPLAPLTVTILQVAAFTIKVLFFCWLQIILRWTLPRFRYDQIMRLGWKMLLPAALVNLFLTAVWIVVRRPA